MQIRDLRIQAITQSLSDPTSLKDAVERLSFIQADPIRSPARAQDLILRQRVSGYRAGDLEKKYPTLGLEEDFLYAYGFLPQSTYRLLHPRRSSKLSKLERRVLEKVKDLGEAHPRDVAGCFARKRVVNAWGGHSAETTEALERLHFRGFLRIVRRENGIRIYQSSKLERETVSDNERFDALIKVIINVLGPIPERSLNSSTVSVRRHFPKPMDARATVNRLIKKGELIRQVIDGVFYLWTPTQTSPSQMARRVRFLAPFDPIVWDRRRFEHFWGWKYKFEAYTPVAQRVRGYYAMPMLWIDRLVGWANLEFTDGRLNVDIGYVDKKPRERDFLAELNDEIGRTEFFLKSNVSF